MCKVIAAWQLVGAEQAVRQHKLYIRSQHMRLQLHPKAREYGFVIGPEGIEKRDHVSTGTANISTS